MKYLIYLCLIIAPIFASSEITSGFLEGYIIDKLTGEDLAFADLLVYQNNKLFTGTTTAADGYFNIKLPGGSYTVEANYIGYKPSSRITIHVEENQFNFLNFDLLQGVTLPLVVITSLGFTKCFDGCILTGTVSCDYFGSTITSAEAKSPDDDKSAEAAIQGMGVFPNPSTGIFNIDVKNKHSFTSSTVFDTHGRDVYSASSESEVNKINISHLPNGTYYIFYRTELGESTAVPIVKIE